MTATDRLLGRLLDGKYRLDAVLGSGGMGVVYSAVDERLGRAVAVKFVRGGATVDATLAERFRREARAAAALHSPHIVTVHDFGVAEGAGAYLVMELLAGRSLRAELEARRRLDVADVAEIARQTCRALRAAHEAGIVHRDLKPENLFLERAGGALAVKVLDFGVAGLASDGGRLTRPGVAVGTPVYMAP